MVFKKKTLGVMLVLFCAACAKVTPIKILSPEDRFSTLQSYSHWDTKGKVGIRQFNSAESANFKWSQTHQDYTIKLHGPLGASPVRVTGNGNVVHFTDEEGHTKESSNPEQLLEEHFGWSIPIDNLHYWVRALPNPNKKVDNLKRDDNKNIETLEQSGWLVTYLDYQNSKGIYMPRKMKLKKDEIVITFIFKRWDLG